MFRDGQYLEVIKASDNCLATAVVTVQERTIEIKKKKVATNKWLDLEDWAALYKILERAILRNGRTERSQQDFEKCEWKKSTRQLEVTYTFEPSECVKDVTSLPTIRVNVSPARKKSEKLESLERTGKNEKEVPNNKVGPKTPDKTYEKDIKTSSKKSVNKDTSAKGSRESKKDKTRRYLQSEGFDNNTWEEYVPNAPSTKKLCVDLKYVPSRKSTLETIQTSSNEYMPTASDNKNAAEVIRYVPNPVETLKASYETYEPCATILPVNLPQEYVPNSKGIKPSVEEYQPGFTSKSMKFDNSYVPSTVRLSNDNSEKLTDKIENLHSQRQLFQRKGLLTKKKGGVSIPKD